MSQPPKIDPSSLDLLFPDPEVPLLQGHGAPCSWRDCMRETAAQTVYYLKHFGHLPPPAPPEEPFRLDFGDARQTDVLAPATARSAPGRLQRLLDQLPEGAEESAPVLMRRLGLRHRGNFRERYLNPALQAGLIQRTCPGQPRSPRQRYRRTPLPQAGRGGAR